MFLSAFGASKPLGPTNDPSYSSVQFLQNFDTLTAGTFPEPFVSQKSGTQWTNEPASSPNSSWQVVSSPSRFGNSALAVTPTPPIETVILSGDFLTDFTFEFSLYGANVGFGFYISFSGYSDTFGGSFDLNTAGTFSGSISSGGSYDTGVSVQYSKWFDFAFTRTGSLVRVFVDGVLKTSFTYANPINRFSPGIRDWNIDDLRISNVCRYTATYTPSHPFINA